MEYEKDRQVIVTDIHMPFLSMVVFMVKWVIASIPAIIILWIIGAILASLFGGMIHGFGGGMGRF